MLRGTKDDDDVNVSIFQTLPACYDVEKKIILSPPGLTRASKEDTIRNAYMPHNKQDVGKGKSQTKAADPHALYAGGVQPPGAGGGGMGKDPKGKPRNGRNRQQHKKQS